MLMVRLVINNSYSKILGLTQIQEKDLRKEFSYIVGGKNSYFSKYGPKRRSLISKYGEFPSGLLNRVRHYLRHNSIKFETESTCKSPGMLKVNSTIKNIKPYDWQTEASDAIAYYARGTIEACTGSGKSIAIALTIAKIGVKTLVVVPNLELKKQLTGLFNEVFEDPSFISVENIDSNNLKKQGDYDLLILDEVHHAASATYQKLNKKYWNGIFFRACFTATAFRNDDEETLLYEGIAGTVRYRLNYKKAVKHGYIVPIEAYYLESAKQKTEAFTYASVYSELVVNNDYKNQMIAYLLEYISSQGKSVLCLVKEINHGKNLSKRTGFRFASGESEESREDIQRFNSGEITTLIGTEGILGEGVDTKPCEFVIIAGLGKAKSNLMQKIGRCVRKYQNKTSGKVFLIKDTSHKYLLRHFKEQCKIIEEEYGIKPLKLDV